MSTDAKRRLTHVLILADESADWKVAGLRQLDRLALALNEFAVQDRREESLVVAVFWKPTLDKTRRWLPKDERLTKVLFSSDFEAQSFDLILSTRLFLYRNAVPQLIEALPSPSEWPLVRDDEKSWGIYSKRLGTFPRSPGGNWEYVTTRAQIDEIERRFLRGAGKSQDGLVSRYLNRPISRAVTRLVLRLPLTPNAWTCLIFPIPIAASLILLDGTYWSFLWGLVLFQIFSILDGCDGEISRAKFLESESGRWLDDLCDVLSNILLAVCLGFGLSRHEHLADRPGWFYVVEGLTTAVLITGNELLLGKQKSENGAAPPISLGGTLYPRHRELVERSGMLLFGEKFAAGLIQLTKHDVAVLFFLFLTAIGQPAWILHLLLAVTVISLALAAKAFGTRSIR